MQVKKILAVYYYYPPVKAVGTRRNVNMLNHLVEITKPSQVMVISTKNKYVSTEKGTQVRYKPVLVRTFDIFAIQHFRSLFINRKKQKIRFIEKQKSKTVLLSPSKLTKFTNSILGVLLLGEGGLIYILSAFFKARKFVNSDTIILTSFSPFSDHLVGWLLKLFYPNTIWIADFRDPFIKKETKNVYAYSFHSFILRKILSKADIVTTVSDGLCDKLKEYSDKTAVVRNAIDMNSVSTFKSISRKKFIINYTGRLYGELSDPSPILNAIANAIKKNKISGKDVMINYAGPNAVEWDSYITRHGLSNINKTHGLISHEEAVELQKEGMINVVVTWCHENYKGVLTTKFFEYMEAGNLILVLIKGQKDSEFEKIVTDTKVGKCFYSHEKDAIEEWLSCNYNKWKAKGFIEANYDMEELKKLTWESQIKEGIIPRLTICGSRKNSSFK